MSTVKIANMSISHIVHEIVQNKKLIAQMVGTLYPGMLMNENVKLLHALKERGIEFSRLSEESINNYIVEYQLLTKE